MSALSRPLLELAAAQDQVVTVAQLVAGGVSDDAVRWRLGTGRWRLLLPGVVLLGPGDPSRRQQLYAAQLLGGPAAALSGRAAARFHGVSGIPVGGAVDVLVPRSRRGRTVGWARIRPSVLVDPMTRTYTLLRVVSLARAVVDAARWAQTQDEATAYVLEAVQRGLTTVADLQQWQWRLNRRDVGQVARAVEEAARGAWSVPEAELLRVVRTSSVLPPAWANPVLRDADGSVLVSPDAWFDAVALAVMVHSRQFHDGAAQWERTVARDGELTARGIVVVGVAPSAIRDDPAGVLTRIEQTFLAARLRPRPAVLAVPRTGAA